MEILITGVTGFIGKNILPEFLNKKNNVTVIVRNQASFVRIKNFIDKVTVQIIDLADTEKLKNFLADSHFDVIIHIGALLGGRKFSKSIFYRVNVDATEQFLIHAYINNSKMIYCSSVGVFGTIPLELPANNQTIKNPDNLYHKTKEQSEKLVEKYSLKGTNAIIVRPSITYGTGDYGFPYTLTKLVHKRLLPVSLQNFKIHLTNISLLKMAFKKLAEDDFENGSSFIVADRNPVVFRELVDFIHKKFYDKPYPVSRFIHPKYFYTGEKIAKFLKSQTWETRFKLLSKSWYYSVEESFEKLSLKKIETIPAFNSVIDWYKETRG